MQIRNFQPGDDVAQLAVYQAAAGSLPNFKPVTLAEVQRRTRAREFDPQSRLYAVEGNQVVGYATFEGGGRVSFPWCLPGHEAVREPLFEAVLTAMRQRGYAEALAAYREDWQAVGPFFLEHGFHLARRMVNFVIDLVEMPTPAALPSTAITPLTPADVPGVLALGGALLRMNNAEQLQRYFFQNPYFTPESLFVLRSRTNKGPVAVGILVDNPAYADPKNLDGNVPCFRLGAFGTEGLGSKRIKGLFSFLPSKEGNLNAMGLDLMGYASYLLRESDDVESLAAQVASDAPELLKFYERNFRRQGSFPVFTRSLK